MKQYLFILISLIVISAVSAEIVVNTGSDKLISHTFLVNKYYSNVAEIISPAAEILVFPIVSEQSIENCAKANFSFKLTNPTLNTIKYSFSVTDFTGTVYLSPEILISGKESRIMHISLLPECDIIGNLNPKIIIETENENAIIPLLLHASGDVISESECRFYYNESICNSLYYKRFYQDNKLSLDLSEYFYDPDQDILSYKTRDNLNLDVKFRKNIAEISARNGFFGSENFIIEAEDGNGGKTENQFYFQVLKSDAVRLPTLLIISLIIIGVLFLLLIIFALRKRD
ncbi:MAG: hypothetical protein ABIJ34_05445 [archaeon]